MKEFFSGGGGACPWSHPPAYGPGLSLPVAFARHNARHCARSKIVRVLMFPVHKKKSQQKYSNIPVSFKLLQTLLQHIRFEIFSRVQKKGNAIISCTRQQLVHSCSSTTDWQYPLRLRSAQWQYLSFSTRDWLRNCDNYSFRLLNFPA